MSMSCLVIGSGPNNDVRYGFNLVVQDKSNKNVAGYSNDFYAIFALLDMPCQTSYCSWKGSQVSMIHGYFYPVTLVYYLIALQK